MNSHKIADAILYIVKRGALDPTITLRACAIHMSEAEMADVARCYEELIENDDDYLQGLIPNWQNLIEAHD